MRRIVEAAGGAPLLTSIRRFKEIRVENVRAPRSPSPMAITIDGRRFVAARSMRRPRADGGEALFPDSVRQKLTQRLALGNHSLSAAPRPAQAAALRRQPSIPKSTRLKFSRHGTIIDQVRGASTTAPPTFPDVLMGNRGATAPRA